VLGTFWHMLKLRSDACSFLEAIDSGKIENTAAPAIAIDYWKLPKDATLRDVVIAVRADEAHHRDVNHFAAVSTRTSSKLANCGGWATLKGSEFDAARFNWALNPLSRILIGEKAAVPSKLQGVQPWKICGSCQWVVNKCSMPSSALRAAPDYAACLMYLHPLDCRISRRKERSSRSHQPRSATISMLRLLILAGPRKRNVLMIEGSSVFRMLHLIDRLCATKIV
jgi:hypothetical protein